MVSESRGAGNVTLGWDPNREADIAGYRLHYGTAHGSYTQHVDVGNTTSAIVRNLIDGATYFFMVTAYKTAALESLPSHEISYPSPDQLRNFSTRGPLHLDGVLIAGFVISGDGEKTVIVRALGPSAALPLALSDPILELHDVSGARIGANDNWRTSQERAIIATGLAPPNDEDSALIATLNAGSYTVVVRDANNATGIGLAEIYDLDDSRDTVRLSNGSARGSVLTGDNVLIAGFIVGGGDWRTTVVGRALGPSLAEFGVPYTLADPTLQLYDGNGTMIASNDNWKDTQQAEIQATGLAPSNVWESAILITLPPGSYTAIATGKDAGMGVGLVELYNLN